MKLPPNDDAALIAASGLASGAHVSDHGERECSTCQWRDLVEAELERRCQVAERKEAGLCVLCGAPFTTDDIQRYVGPDWQMAHLEGRCPRPGEVIPLA